MSKTTKRRKRRRETRAAEGRQRNQWIWIGAGVIGVLLLVGVVAWSIQRANQPVPGEAVPIQGQQHVAVGQSHPPYNSDPPTSGWHYDEPVKAGFYENSLPDEQLVHIGNYHLTQM